MSVGDNIRKLRKERKMTQVQLAKKANISRSYLGDIENSRYNVSLDVLNKIASALGTSAPVLLREDDPELASVLNGEEELKKKIINQLKLLTDDDGFFYEYLREDIFQSIVSSNLYMAPAFHNAGEDAFYENYFSTYFSSLDDISDNEHEEAMEMFNKAYEIRTIKAAIKDVNFDVLDDLCKSLEEVITKHNLENKVADFELTKKDEKDIQDKLLEIINDLNSKDGYAALDGKSLSEVDEEDRELLIASLEQSLRIAKRLAKEKFTPKKYRK